MNNTPDDKMKQVTTRFSLRFASFICSLLILPVFCLTPYADDSNNLPAREHFKAGTKPEWGALDGRHWHCRREIPASVREMQTKHDIGTHQEEVDIVITEVGYRVSDSDDYVYNGTGDDFIAGHPRGIMMRSMRIILDSQGNGDMLIIEESAKCRHISEPGCTGVPPVVKVMDQDDLTVTSYLSCM